MAHNGGGLKPVAVVTLTLALLACSTQTAPPPQSPAAEGETLAADLRTQLDLLLSEHVMIVAKETSAAVNHSDDYPAYTTLLTTNVSDLATLFGRAFGNTAAADLSQLWNTQNALLVDYAIGVVTHNDDKANAAMTSLTGQFVPQFAQLVNRHTFVARDQVVQLQTKQLLKDKAFIDDVFAKKYGAYYSDLHAAYANSSLLGDTLAVHIVQRFPDKFPGDPSLLGVDIRVSFNLVLQEHAHLATMATASVIAGRTVEKSAAEAALASNAGLLSAAFVRLYDTGASAQLDRVWSARNKLILDYASGADPTSTSLTQDVVTMFAYLTHVDRLLVLRQMQATIKVIDDQKAKSFKPIAGDDRAAATAMQAIADSIQG